MQQNHVEYLMLVYTNMMKQKKLLRLEDRDIYHIIISKDYFRNLIKNKNYAILGESNINLKIDKLYNKIMGRLLKSNRSQVSVNNDDYSTNNSTN